MSRLCDDPSYLGEPVRYPVHLLEQVGGFSFYAFCAMRWGLLFVQLFADCELSSKPVGKANGFALYFYVTSAGPL